MTFMNLTYTWDDYNSTYKIMIYFGYVAIMRRILLRQRSLLASIYPLDPATALLQRIG